MISRWKFGARGVLIAAVVTAGAVGIAAMVNRARASDHQDTPEVELNPRMDINDVYAFPGSSPDRIALVMTTSSPIAGAQNVSFDPNLLYQLKIDNTGDAKEDLVFQITFDHGTGTNQQVTIRGPVAPVTVGTGNRLVTTGTALTGAVGNTLGSATGMQAYTGLREDPFFIDLEQFFNILPDRRPSTGPLSTPLTPGATAFRDPGIDLLGALHANALSIVIELPKSMLVSSGAADAHFGLWGTISR